MRSSHGENAMRTVITRRRPDQPVSFGAVEYPKHDEMRKSIDIQQPILIFRKYFQRPFSRVLGSATLRNLTGVSERAANVANRLHHPLVHDK